MKIKYSCVLDYNPIMEVQCYIWLTSLLHIGIKPKTIYVHLVSDVTNEFLSFLKSKQINIVNSNSFDVRNKYCNKLVQLETFTNQDDFDYVFLMDCDTAVVDLNGISLTDEVYAKVVDFPNPPFDILQSIFAKNNLEIEKTESTFPLNEEQLTDWNNCNGGLYIISKDFLKSLAPKWIHYANLCIEQKDIFTDTYSKHADQVGFALAMASLGKKVTHLDIEWNYPIHINNPIEVDPKIIHFHNEINEHLQIKPKNRVVVKEAIELINDRVNSNLVDNLSNSLFWNFRYYTCPDLGSGVGSRGKILEEKKKLLRYLTYGKEQSSYIDVGCGDLELMKEMPFENYLGLDVSIEAIKIGKEKRPDWNFKMLPITDSSIENVDITMCFDVLIHQSDITSFNNIVYGLVSKANNRVIIGAYNDKPEFNSTITHFHNSIFDEVAQYNKFNEIAIVKKYRDVSVIVGTLHENKHQRDITSENLNKAFKEVKRPDLLQYIVDVSRHNFGFYTAHYPRVFEYTWIVEQLEDKKDIKVLDIGAGVCPVPLCLTDMGMRVTTVDLHPTVRLLKDKDNWNEWGYLDYSIFNKTIDSKHQDFTKVRTLKRFDCIYSVSVIEHMPRSIRLKMLKRASKLLKKGGELLLTIDIVPDTSDIWNYSEGKQVESEEEHGTMESFKNELLACGFKIVFDHIQREIFESRTDVWFVKCVLHKKSFI